MRHRSFFFLLAAVATVGATALGAALVWSDRPATGRWMASPAPGVSLGTPAPSVSSARPSFPQPTKGCGGQWDCEQQQRFTAALALLNQRPGTLSAVVGDQRTGAVWRAGATTS